MNSKNEIKLGSIIKKVKKEQIVRNANKPVDLAKIDEVSDSDLSVHSTGKDGLEIHIPLERQKIVQIDE